jgi:uridylate kinase
MKYSRILLKLSGEALMGEAGHGVDPTTAAEVCAEVASVRELGVEVAIVVGGGNVFRGAQGEQQGIARVTGDYIGMVATLVNALILQSILEGMGIATRVQSALHIEKVAEPFIRRKAIRHLEKGRVVIFAGGTGNPYFTTDTAAAIRALEIGAGVFLKATKVDGVYDRDPVLHHDATFFSEISYDDVLHKGLKVMDATAVALCMENDLPVIVFNMRGKGNLTKIVQGASLGTIVRRKNCKA